MYVKCMALICLDDDMFVAGAWVPIKFRWYPRMRGQGWADFKPCKYKCFTAHARECIVVLALLRALLWHSRSCGCMHTGGGACCDIYRACAYYTHSHVCVPDRSYVTMIMMCMYHYWYIQYHCMYMCWRYYIGNTYTLFTVWNAWNGNTVKWVVGVVVNSTVCVLLHIIHLFISGIYMIYEYGDYACMWNAWHWYDWMVICLLQDLGQQSNFGDTLECVDRVERTSNPVSLLQW